jgi:subtilase family serine protease
LKVRLLLAVCLILLTIGCFALVFFSPIGSWTPSTPPGKSPSPAGAGVDQIRRAYGFDKVRENGAHQTIAVVEPYDDPATGSDLAVFSEAFGLPVPAGALQDRPCTIHQGPHPCFERVSPNTKAPPSSTWAAEGAGAVEWVHAIAPAADLLLVESPSNQMRDLVTSARSAADRGATVVVMTWGMPEQAGFRQLDRLLSVPGVAFVAASGDSGHGVNYPAASPNVIAVGGTFLELDDAGNRKAKEVAWDGSGGGFSATEPIPDYQRRWDRTASGRLVPDISIAASPTRGFASYSTGGGGAGWHQVVGTSVGATLWAALVALIDQRLGQAIETAAPLYAAAQAAGIRPFDDIARGTNGACGPDCSSGAGYDAVTGLGTPNVPSLLDVLMNSGYLQRTSSRSL